MLRMSRPDGLVLLISCATTAARNTARRARIRCLAVHERGEMGLLPQPRRERPAEAGEPAWLALGPRRLGEPPTKDPTSSASATAVVDAAAALREALDRRYAMTASAKAFRRGLKATILGDLQSRPELAAVLAEQVLPPVATRGPPRARDPQPAGKAAHLRRLRVRRLAAAPPGAWPELVAQWELPPQWAAWMDDREGEAGGKALRSHAAGSQPRRPWSRRSTAAPACRRSLRAATADRRRQQGWRSRRSTGRQPVKVPVALHRPALPE